MAARDLPKDTTGGFMGLANVAKLRANPFEFLLGLARTHDGIAPFRFGPMGDFYLVTEPDYIREILVKQPAKTIKWERLTNASNRVAAFNIVFLDGDVWKSQRKLLAPAFHTERVQRYRELICRQAAAMTRQWDDGRVLDTHQAMVRLTMGIIGEILFGIADIEQDAADLASAIETLLTQFVVDAGALVVLPKWLPPERHRKDRAARKTIVTYLGELIQVRRESGVDHGDVLSALLMATDAETGAALTDSEIRDELYSLFVAGHETTANWLSWALHLLAIHPDIQADLRGELRQSSAEEAAASPLLDAVLNETLRMYPPAWSLFMRRVVEDIPLGPYVIPAGAIIYISPYVQHHLPQYWEDPEAFRPARFLSDFRAERPAYAYMPFGGGPRVCLGATLAEFEARIIMATILESYHVELADPSQAVYKNGGFTLRPVPEIVLGLKQADR